MKNSAQLQEIENEGVRNADVSELSNHILEYLEENHGKVWSLLIDGSPPHETDNITAQDLCDVIYSLYFLDWPIEPSQAGVTALIDFLASMSLSGNLNRPASAETTSISVHGTAYLLSTLALLKLRKHDLFDQVIASDGWCLDNLVDPVSLLPKWPSKWSHHNWRVSHWIGGSVSILNELARHLPKIYKANHGPDVGKVLAASDRLIDERSGALKCYRSRLLQFAFRQAYRLRHDPMLGDIGGVVHLHWVNYANKRAYKSGEQLFRRSADAMLKHHPFMETVPYCLDFDVVQIVRTSMPNDLPAEERRSLRARARDYASDILGFLDTRLDSEFALHKLPGALATLHECALIDETISLAELCKGSRDTTWPKDVMSEVSWL